MIIILLILSLLNLDLSKIRNIIIIATMLVVGLGGAQIVFETNDAGAVVSGLQGMSLAAIVGVVLNLVLPEVENAE